MYEQEKVMRKVMKRLEKVIDPHTGISVMRMKLITDVSMKRVGKRYHVIVFFRPDLPECPYLEEMMEEIVKKLEKMMCISSAEVKVETAVNGRS